MKNTFLDYGYSKEEIENRVNDTFYAIFEGHNRFYFDGINETGYFMDTGNCDARTEGMSYGMLMCVLMDKKEYFDKMWKFSMDFMYMDEGYLKGYFAWSVAPDGKKNAKFRMQNAKLYFVFLGFCPSFNPFDFPLFPAFFSML